MKRFTLLLLLIFTINNVFAIDFILTHSYSEDFSLFPDNNLKDYYIKTQLKSFPVNYSVQSVLSIPKSEAKGFSCDQILSKLDQMGGLEKDCNGVSYIDENTKERKALFKKSEYTVSQDNKNKGELYVKDKAAGGLYFDVSMNKYVDNATYYIVYGILNRSPTNFFVRGIKKDEASIFVLMQESEENINVYAVIQSSYSPANHRFLKSFVETSVAVRVTEIENWFYRMLCLGK